MRGDPPSLTQFWQHVLLAGPMLGFVSGAIQYMLSESSPHAMTRSTGNTILQTSTWHGRYLGCYYITPDQMFLQQCLSAAVGAWMILLLVVLIWTGIRLDADRRKKR